MNYFDVMFESPTQPQIDALLLIQGNELIGKFKVCNDHCDFIQVDFMDAHTFKFDDIEMSVSLTDKEKVVFVSKKGY